jgi:tripartite-type tricarboxylate transporter receptor subunit TctC
MAQEHDRSSSDHPRYRRSLERRRGTCVKVEPSAVAFKHCSYFEGIAILTKEPLTVLPNLPTNIEEGVPGLASDTLTGIVAPAGTPKEIVDKWNVAIPKMVADPEIKKKLDTLGFVPVCNSLAEFSERIKSEAAHWDKVVMVVGVHVD